MTNPIEPVRRPAILRLLPQAAVRPAHGVARRLTAIADWARLRKSALRLGTADAVVRLDPQSRTLMWHALTEIVATIGLLATADVPPPKGLAGIAALTDRLRDRVAIAPPPITSLVGGAEPPHLLVLEILIRDLQPSLHRWQPRLDAWRNPGRDATDWPLLGLCRSDLARTRERLVERGWQIGIALELPSLERLLPERPAVVPELIATGDLAEAEAAISAPPDPALIEAGWHIYVEAASRFPARGLPITPGALGEAIADLDTLADKVRAALKAMPCPRPNGADETIELLGFRLLSEGLHPFLSEWRPRYRRFSASERSEAKWRRADECRAALIATRTRCLATVEEIGLRLAASGLGVPGLRDDSRKVAVAAGSVRSTEVKHRSQPIDGDNPADERRGSVPGDLAVAPTSGVDK
jgi:hypothetical protein